MNLKELRRMADLTQFEVAVLSGVSRMRLSLAECGHLTLDSKEDSLIRATLLGVIKRRLAQFDEVLSNKDEPEVELQAKP